MNSYGRINQFLMIYTALVVLKCHGTGIHILHGRVYLMITGVNTVLLKFLLFFFFLHSNRKCAKWMEFSGCKME